MALDGKLNFVYRSRGEYPRESIVELLSRASRRGRGSPLRRQVTRIASVERSEDRIASATVRTKNSRLRPNALNLGASTTTLDRFNQTERSITRELRFSRKYLE